MRIRSAMTAGFILLHLVNTGCHVPTGESGNEGDGGDNVGMVQFAVPVKDAVATTLVFVSSTCPIANGYAPEINRLAAEYEPQGVAFCLVHTERDLTQAAAAEHQEKYGYHCEYLLDPERKLVEQTGVTITPEAAVLSPDGEVLYRGRIDDRFPDIGIQRDQPTTTELRDALDEILAGKPVSVPVTEAVGCFIE